jgi:hypothetical protein
MLALHDLAEALAGRSHRSRARFDEVAQRLPACVKVPEEHDLALFRVSVLYRPALCIEREYDRIEGSCA